MPPPVGPSTTPSSSPIRHFQPVPVANAQIPDIPVPPNTFLGPQTQRAVTDTGPVFPRPALTPPQAKTRFTAGGLALYPHQAEMCSKVTARLPHTPWVGVASPMQTGKSQGITAVVSEVQDQYEQIIVIADSREGFSQCVSRLSAELGQDNVGTFSGSGKNIRKVMVATRHALYKHLAEFDPAKKNLIVLDEAITTQCPSLRRILHHFALGQPETREAKEAFAPLTPAQISRGKFVPNPDTQNRLIGLSATGGGLEGYEVAFRMDMLSAIEQRWLRDIEGEQIFLNPSAEERRSTDPASIDSVTYQVVDKPGDTQIWWRATEANAKILARVYFDKIHGKYSGNHIFIPTIYHGKLLLNALEEEFVARGCGTLDDAKALFGFVYSADTVTETTEDGKIWVKKKPRDEALNKAELKKWRHGGTVLSIGKLNRSYSATGTGAIFHTYQTESSELFAQRTGRGWGNNKECNLPPLFVLEATWSREQRFMNLARLLGLSDYPFGRVDSKNLRQHIPEIRIRKNMGEELDKQITAGTVHPLFGEIPLAARWRIFFRRAADDHAGGLAAMAETTEIPQVYLEGFRQGGLPLSLAQIEALSKTLGDRQNLIERWVLDWMDVATDLKNGTRHLGNPKKFSHVPDQLIDWLNAGYKPAEAEAKAQALEKILSVYFVYPMCGPLVTLLQGALHVFAKYDGWRGLTVFDETLDGDASYKISAQSIADVLFGRIGEPQWRRLMHGLIVYFDNLANAQPSPEFDEPQMTPEYYAQMNQDAKEQQTLLIHAIFERRGWATTFASEEEEELYKAREFIVRRFGDQWPVTDTIIPGLTPFTKANPLTAWISSGEKPDAKTAKGISFKALVSRLMTAMGQPHNPFLFGHVKMRANNKLLAIINQYRHLFFEKQPGQKKGETREVPRTLTGTIKGAWDTDVPYSISANDLENLSFQILNEERWLDLAINISRFFAGLLWEKNASTPNPQYAKTLDEVTRLIAQDQGWPIARFAIQLDGVSFDYYSKQTDQELLGPLVDLRMAWGTCMNLIPLFGLNWPEEFIPKNGELEQWLKGMRFSVSQKTFRSPILPLADRKRLYALETRHASQEIYRFCLDPTRPDYITGNQQGIRELMSLHAARANGWSPQCDDMGIRYKNLLGIVRNCLCFHFCGGFLPGETIGTVPARNCEAELKSWLSGVEPRMTKALEATLRHIIETDGNHKSRFHDYIEYEAKWSETDRQLRAVPSANFDSPQTLGQFWNQYEVLFLQLFTPSKLDWKRKVHKIDHVWSQKVTAFVTPDLIENMERARTSGFLFKEDTVAFALTLARCFASVVLDEKKKINPEVRSACAEAVHQLIQIVAQSKGWPIATIMAAVSKRPDENIGPEEIYYFEADLANEDNTVRLAWGVLMNLLLVYGLDWPQDLLPNKGTLAQWLCGTGSGLISNGRAHMPYLDVADRRQLVALEQRLRTKRYCELPISLKRPDWLQYDYLEGVKYRVAGMALFENGWVPLQKQRDGTVIARDTYSFSGDSPQLYERLRKEIRCEVIMSYQGDFLEGDKIKDVDLYETRTDLLAWLNGPEPRMTQKLAAALRVLCRGSYCGCDEAQLNEYLETDAKWKGPKG